MNQELQDAYNEWLIKFGFREVIVFKAMWCRHIDKITTYEMKPFGTNGAASWYTLKQPHEILDTETQM